MDRISLGTITGGFDDPRPNHETTMLQITFRRYFESWKNLLMSSKSEVEDVSGVLESCSGRRRLNDV